MAWSASESCCSGTLQIYVLEDLRSGFPSRFERKKSGKFSAASLTFSVHSFCANNSSRLVQSASRTLLSQLTGVRDFPSWLPLCSFLHAVTAEKWWCGRLKLIFCDEDNKSRGKEKKKISVLMDRFWGGKNPDCFPYIEGQYKLSFLSCAN